MASSSSSNKDDPKPIFPNRFDPNSTQNTTFVQADPTTFRAVVQQLTGSKPNSTTKPAFKLHQRRPTARKLEIELSVNGGDPDYTTVKSPAARTQRNFHGQSTVMFSPVSPLEYGSPTTPRSPMEEEEKAIAEKRFYLHPSSRGSDPPELLPLFPLHSPRDD